MVRKVNNKTRQVKTKLIEPVDEVKEEDDIIVVKDEIETLKHGAKVSKKRRSTAADSKTAKVKKISKPDKTRKAKLVK